MIDEIIILKILRIQKFKDSSIANNQRFDKNNQYDKSQTNFQRRNISYLYNAKLNTC